MLIDIIKLCRDKGIPYATEGSKHTRSGWVQLRCPFCNHKDKWFLGYNTSSGAVTCWHCGKHGIVDTIRLSLRINRSKAFDLIRRYQIGKGKQVRVRASKRQQATVCKLPPMCGPVAARHTQYLLKRKFNADEVIKTWGLLGTGIHGSYKNRIIAPVYLNGELVSYQGRDITDRHALKYKACELENEVVCHQHTLYGIDLVPSDICVLVEGIADAWRLGPGACATFGTSFTLPQVNLAAAYFKKVYTLFDPEYDAQARADNVGVLLTARGVEVECLEYDGDCDPGDMPQAEADQLMKELLS